MPSAPPPSWVAGVRRVALPNGLTLLARTDPSAPVAAVVTHVRAGFLDEPDEWQGLSHVLEHMYFKGTPTRGVGAVARETKGLGGYLNASTSYDRTSYYVVMPVANLRQAVAIQADALQHASLDPEELARELRVIIEEAKRKRDTPAAVAGETLHELLFDRHRIRRWRIGQEEALARFDATQLRAYYASRYVPSRTIVSIVAAAPVEEILDLAQEAYGGWPTRSAEVPAGPVETSKPEVRVRTIRGDVAQADLAVGWRGVPPLDPSESALEMAAAILAAGRGSRLQVRLRETGIATGVGAAHYSSGDVGVFGVYADGDPAQLPRMIDGIAAELTQLARVGPTADELERARTLLQVRWARQFESYEGSASALAAAEALGGVHLIDEEYAAMLAVDPGTVRVAVARYLDPDAISAVVSLPTGRGPDLTPAALTRSFAVEALAVAPAAPVPVAPLPPRRVKGVDTAGVRHVATEGADLILRRRSGTPLLTLGVYFPRVRQERQGDAGLAMLTMRSMVRGAGPFDASALALASERLGGALNPVTTHDWVGLGLTLLAEEAGNGAALLRTVLSEPHLAPAGIELERGLLLEEARQRSDDMFRYPYQLAFEGAFGPEGYGLPVAGTLESIPGIDAAAVRPWHAEGVLQVRPLVVAVGDGDLDGVADLLAGAFAGWGAGTGNGRPAVQGWRVAGAAIERVVERDKRQTALAMLFPGPDRRGAGRAAAEVWGAIASGLGGRLFEALRDRRSLAYTVLASAWTRRSGGALTTYIATAPEREEEARAAMLSQLQGFAERPPTAAELGQAVNYLAGQAQVARQSAGALAHEVVEAWIAGRGVVELEDPAAEYRGVTAAAVQEVAQRYLDPARRSEGVVRGREGASGA